MPIRFTEPPGPENIVNQDGGALLLAMLLDQQIPIEWAFAGPARLAERMNTPGTLDLTALAALDPEDVVALCSEKPALHRYPRSMGIRVHDLARFVCENYGGTAEAIWHRARSGQVVYDRLVELPGFGPEKAKITLAVLAKRMGKRVSGWETIVGTFADDNPRSVADVGSSSDLARLRQFRKQQKEQGRAKDQ